MTGLGYVAVRGRLRFVPTRESRHAIRRSAVATVASASPARPRHDRFPRSGLQWRPTTGRVCVAAVSPALHLRPRASAWFPSGPLLTASGAPTDVIQSYDTS